MTETDIAAKNDSPASGIYRITAEKNITDSYCIELEKTILANIGRVKQAVVFDMSKISTIDSAGLALCVGLLKECQRRGQPLRFEVSPEIRKLFMLMKFDKILTLVDGNS